MSSTPEKRGPGHPVSLTPEKAEAFKQALTAQCTVRQACYYSGIGYRTWCDWKRRILSGDRFDEGVAALVEEHRRIIERAQIALVSQLRRHAAKDPRAAMFLVTRRDETEERVARQRKAKADALRAELALERERLEADLLRLKIAAGGVEQHSVTVTANDARSALAKAIAGSAGAPEPAAAGGDDREPQQR